MRSLQARLALAIGVLVTVLWVGAAVVTAHILRNEMNEVFDSALQETAQRLLPLAVADILDREDEGIVETVSPVRAHDEHLTYVVRNAAGQVLILSHTADPANFPPYSGPGFHDTASYRIFSDEALRGSVTISVAEPLGHRDEIAREVQMGLGLPLLAVIPLSLAGIAFLVRYSFRPLRRFRIALARRGARDLSALECSDLPAEILPMGETLNGLLVRLKLAFEAERSFAANAAHELRTPLAGAIAQAQRLQVETTDKVAAQRAGEIERTLKRLTRLSERLMQLARAEGGKLRLEAPSDLRPILQMMVGDARRAGAGEIGLTMPDGPVMSDLDPDVFGILCRNLIDNAQRHGTAAGGIAVELHPDGRLCVQNDCDPIPPEVLVALDARFTRAANAGEGSGIGLAIVRTIAERAQGRLELRSPIPGQERGFSACVGFAGTVPTGH